ncbi:MAG: hypothetical protein QOH97_38 [Actinoplanes sp.]|jgi:hypothetical protein|nr:hypothetical protein [Actinoplanes sp.]
MYRGLLRLDADLKAYVGDLFSSLRRKGPHTFGGSEAMQAAAHKL